MMNSTMQMMQMHAKDMSTSGMTMTDQQMAMMQECIEACSACEQACTVCASCMMGTESGGAMHMEMCLNTADMSNTMMRMMMRPAGLHAASMMAMLDAMVTQCNACADECMKHADMHEDCAMCAEVCRQCAMSCQKAIDAMKSMAPME
jgi:hypothetical protein